MAKKKIKVRDLKPKKDAKGGGAAMGAPMGPKQAPLQGPQQAPLQGPQQGGKFFGTGIN